MSDDLEDLAEEELSQFRVRADETLEMEEPDEPVMGEPESEEDLAKKNRKWFGVPPAGKKPLPSSLIPGTSISLGPGWNHTVHIIALIIVEILLWAIYRGVTGPIFAGFGTTMFYVMHIIFAPTIHLGPIIIYWKLIRKEPGIPFMFTRKNLFTGVALGLAAGTIWRVFQFLIYDTLAVLSGIHDSGTMTWWNLMGGPGYWGNFVLMTFVMYVVVGPVEEFEFRSFALDQMWRGKSVVVALTISSILFGCSHIPIAIFVYKFPPMMFIAALTGWIIAGVVLGIVYVVTRNIWAAIVMHAVGNWTLGVMLITSASAGGEYTAINMAVDIATTVLADGLMLLIFLAIFKFIWHPRLMERKFSFRLFKGLDGFGNYNSRKESSHLVKVVAILVGINIIFLGSVMGFTAAFGTPIWDDIIEDDGPVGEFESSSFSVEPGEGFTLAGYADEESEQHVPFALNMSNGKYLKSITVSLTWTDEEDYRRVARTFENAPDEFGLTVTLPAKSDDENSQELNGSAPMTANTHGQSQTITLTIEVEHQTEESTAGTGTWDITIICGVCDDKYASGPALLKYNDLGNDFTLDVTTENFVSENAGEE